MDNLWATYTATGFLQVEIWNLDSVEKNTYSKYEDALQRCPLKKC